MTTHLTSFLSVLLATCALVEHLSARPSEDKFDWRSNPKVEMSCFTLNMDLRDLSIELVLYAQQDKFEVVANSIFSSQIVGVEGVLVVTDNVSFARYIGHVYPRVLTLSPPDLNIADFGPFPRQYIVSHLLKCHQSFIFADAGVIFMQNPADYWDHGQDIEFGQSRPAESSKLALVATADFFHVRSNLVTLNFFQKFIEALISSDGTSLSVRENEQLVLTEILNTSIVDSCDLHDCEADGARISMDVESDTIRIRMLPAAQFAVGWAIETISTLMASSVCPIVLKPAASSSALDNYFWCQGLWFSQPSESIRSDECSHEFRSLNSLASQCSPRHEGREEFLVHVVSSSQHDMLRTNYLNASATIQSLDPDETRAVSSKASDFEDKEKYIDPVVNLCVREKPSLDEIGSISQGQSIHIIRAQWAGEGLPQLLNQESTFIYARDYPGLKPIKRIGEPFLVSDDCFNYLFLKAEVPPDLKGVIAVLMSSDGINWSMFKVVLEEQTALSTPFVFMNEDAWYMAVTVDSNQRIDLYKSYNFPFDWRLEGKLLDGRFFAPNIFRTHGHWLIFVSTWLPKVSASSRKVFYSKELFGEWIEHPMESDEPIVSYGSSAVKIGDEIWTFNAVTSPDGIEVFASKLVMLSIADYYEEQLGPVYFENNKYSYFSHISHLPKTGHMLVAIEPAGVTAVAHNTQVHSSELSRQIRESECSYRREDFHHDLSHRNPPHDYDGANFSKIHPLSLSWRPRNVPLEEFKPPEHNFPWKTFATGLKLIFEQAGIQNFKTIFEVGCGVGNALEVLHLLQPAVQLAGCDVLNEVVRVIRRLLPTGAFCPYDGSNFGWVKSGSFDCAFSYGVFGLGNEESLIDEMLRIIKPGGTLVVDVRLKKGLFSEILQKRRDQISKAEIIFSAGYGEGDQEVYIILKSGDLSNRISGIVQMDVEEVTNHSPISWVSDQPQKLKRTLLRTFIQYVEEVELLGDIVATGMPVAKATTALAEELVRFKSCRRLWLYDGLDSMSGDVVQSSDQELGPNVEIMLKAVGFGVEQATFRKGWFDKTFLLPGPSRIAVLHVDCDFYNASLLTLETFYDRVVDGGVVAFDDFGHWEGQRIAFYDFVRSRNLYPLLERFGHAMAWFVKGKQHNRDSHRAWG